MKGPRLMTSKTESMLGFNTNIAPYYM